MVAEELKLEILRKLFQIFSILKQTEITAALQAVRQQAAVRLTIIHQTKDCLDC